MKIAVTSQNRKTVTPHAGVCRRFWIYETKQGVVVSKTLLELAKEESFRESDGQSEHPLDTINVLIAGGMGAGLQQRLSRRGIDARTTTEMDPDQAVRLYLTET